MTVWWRAGDKGVGLVQTNNKLVLSVSVQKNPTCKQQRQPYCKVDSEQFVHNIYSYYIHKMWVLYEGYPEVIRTIAVA